jgi:hypothetical protein
MTGTRLYQYKSSMPEFNDFAIYELTGQILYIDNTPKDTMAIILENLKGAAAVNQDVLTQVYGDMEAASAKFLTGDPMWDYNPQQFWVYPTEAPKVIESHKLKMVRSKIYVDDFYGNLYHSDNGYYVVITEFNQKDMRGVPGLGIGEARVYRSLEEVAAAEKEYEKKKVHEWKSEHFYRKISDQYGKNFPSKIDSMIDSMCAVLNIDRSQLTFDTVGIDLVDMAIHWNHDRYWLFDRWYPGALAFYGECYKQIKGDGKWIVRQEKSDGEDGEVLVPHLVLEDGEDVFDSNSFYKSLMEWPIGMQIAGDWDGTWREYKRRQKEDR